MQKLFVGAASLALVGLGGMLNTASANGGGIYHYTSECSPASRALYAGGIAFTATDECSDGHSAVTQWRKAGETQIRTLWNPNGSGSSTQQSTAYNGELDLRSCIGEYGDKTIISCSSWKSL